MRRPGTSGWRDGRYVFANGYAFDVECGPAGEPWVTGFARSHDGRSDYQIPFVAGPNALRRGPWLAHAIRLFRPGSPDRDVEEIALRIAALQPAGTPGRTVAAWGSTPADVVAGAIEWLRRQDPAGLLAGFVRSAGSARSLILDRRVETYAVTLRLKLENAGCLVRDPDLARADLVVSDALDALLDVQDRRDAGLDGLDWRHGDDLTDLIVRVGSSRPSGENAVAAYIGRDLTRLRLSPLEVEGASLMKGASKLWNGLFSGGQWRLQHPDRWVQAQAFAAAVARARTQFPVTLWHGFGFQADALRTMPTGEVLPGRPGFLHTSLSRVEALKHTYHRPLLGRIRLPVGSPALFVGGHPYEHEVMLPPNTSLRLIARRTGTLPDGITTGEGLCVDLDPIFAPVPSPASRMPSGPLRG